MAFSEKIKLQVRRKAAFRCCRCYKIGIQIHHIIPKIDNKDNAAPLCPSCHDYFGDNPKKRKEIRQMRDWWYKVVKDNYEGYKEKLLEIEKIILKIQDTQKEHTKKISLLRKKLGIKITSLDKKIDFSKIYSPSKLKMFDQCPKSYDFCYRDHIYSRMKAELARCPQNIFSFHTLGKAVHNAITLFYHLPLEKRTKKQLLENLKETWKSGVMWHKNPPLGRWGGFKDLKEEKKYYRLALVMLNNFFNMAEVNPTIEYLPSKDITHSIKDFINLLTPLSEDFSITGKFDLIVKEKNNSLHIINFKTGIMSQKVNRFHLRFYKLLAETHFEKPVKRFTLYFLQTGHKKTFDLEKENTEKIKKEILNKIKRLNKETKFKAKPTKLCQYCLFRSFCVVPVIKRDV